MKTQTLVQVPVTPEVARALRAAKRRYPALSDALIFEIGLSQLPKVMSDVADDTPDEIMRIAAHALNVDGYLEDPAEDIYRPGMGKPNNFGA